MAVFLPLVRATQVAALAVDRLLLLPVSRLRLHLADVVGGLADPLLLLTMPACLTLPLGLVLLGRFLASVVSLLGVSAY